MNPRIILGLLLVLCFLKDVKAQDPQFSQFTFAPVYVNPALAGETRQWKITMNSRMQWMSTPAKYVSNAFTAEYNAAANNSGIAAQIIHDQAGSGKLTYVSAGGIYSYKARLTRMLKLNFGIKGSVNQRYFDRGALQFPSDIADNSANIQSVSLRDKVSYFDIGTGVALASRRWWGGISFDHINQPNYAFSNTPSKLAMKYSAHIMYEFIVGRDIKKRVVRSFVAGANYKAQLQWDQFDLGGYYKYHSVLIGMFYRGLPLQTTVPDNFNHDALYLITGYKWKGLQINYSYDITVSKVKGDTGGSHEFSLITEYPFNPKKRRRSSRLLPCYKF